MITPAQCRAARALLKWTFSDLAERSQVSVSTINSFELERRQPIPANLGAIRRAFEAGGVDFIAENGGGAGVRLAKGKRKARQA
jgi:transcriptional regulator with XRE-family HTH domain